ncbi:MAG: tRNA lysidine(34) synthetase TilS [Deltaproteobacteria bacterium]|nr:tRNA lysidine(34) synthetase TilS [Deltaproteobacteria bacterium]
MQDPLVRQVRRALKMVCLLREGRPIVVGVSGGPDSVVLAHVLSGLADSLQAKLVIAHVNYGLRGRASKGDEAFVRGLAKRLGRPLHVKRVRPTVLNNLAPARNIQEWAREIRYRFFAKVAKREGAPVVAVGHQQDDQCETVLMNLIRGAGPAGLGGMAVNRTMTDGVGLIRPLLALPRSEILAYVKRHRIAYRRDASNRADIFQRNRIRNRLLPLLAKLNPRAIAHIVAAADRLREESDAMEAMAVAALARCTLRSAASRLALDREALVRLPRGLRLRVLRRAYLNLSGDLQGLGEDHLVHMDGLAHGIGGSYCLPGPIRCERAGPRLVLRPGK